MCHSRAVLFNDYLQKVLVALYGSINNERVVFTGNRKEGTTRKMTDSMQFGPEW